MSLANGGSLEKAKPYVFQCARDMSMVQHNGVLKLQVLIVLSSPIQQNRGSISIR
jgi:hypothetical protein